MKKHFENKTFRLLALDLDGTVLTNDKRITKPVRDALEKAASMGIIVLPASGRPFSSLPDELFTLTGLNYVITSNGAAVYHLGRREKCYERCLQRETIEQILSFFPDYAGIEASMDDITYIDRSVLEMPEHFHLSERTASYLRATRTGVDDIRTFLQKRCAFDCIDIIYPSGNEEAELMQKLTRTIPGIYVTSSVPGLLEISRARGGKCEGLMWAQEQFSILPEEMISFGDGFNDLEMIRHAGLGVAMENGHPLLKEAADLIAPSNEEDGVAVVLEELFRNAAPADNP